MLRALDCFLGERYCADEDHFLLVHHVDGRTALLPGPAHLRRKALAHRLIEVKPHERVVARETELVEVVFRDGRTERRHGPCTVTRDPFQHATVQTLPIPRHVANANQRILVQYRSGEVELRDGPCELVLDPNLHERMQVQPIERYVAEPQQYLVVTHRDGRKEHVRGPAELQFNAFEHEAVAVHDAVRLAANEAVVVYRRQLTSAAAVWARLDCEVGALEAKPAADAPAAVDAAGAADADSSEHGGAIVQAGALRVQRRVVHGPALFMPEANEWLHTFSWHGSVSRDGKGSKTGYAGDVKVPHALNFQTLRKMPDQMYFSVRDVRTLDDASITVHLMLFYELAQIETMLDATNDLIGDMCSATSADVITFAAGQSYELLLQHSAQLSSLDSFPILAARMAQVGCRLLKVVYRGYSTSAQLQEMHDEAVTRRTRMRLEADQAREEQEKRAMELRCRQERSKQELELKEAEARHKLALEKLAQAQASELADAEHATALRQEGERLQAQLAHRRAEHEEETRAAREQAAIRVDVARAAREQDEQRYAALNKLGVDLTAYLTALAASKPDAHVRIEGGAPAGAGSAAAVVPNIHFQAGGAKPVAGATDARHHPMMTMLT